MIPHAALRRMRHGWRPVDVPEDAASGVRQLPTLCALKVNCEKLMRMVDALPPDLRAQVHEVDWKTVAALHPEAVRQAWWKAAENNWGRG